MQYVTRFITRKRKQPETQTEIVPDAQKKCRTKIISNHEIESNEDQQVPELNSAVVKPILDGPSTVPANSLLVFVDLAESLENELNSMHMVDDILIVETYILLKRSGINHSLWGKVEFFAVLWLAIIAEEDYSEQGMHEVVQAMMKTNGKHKILSKGGKIIRGRKQHLVNLRKVLFSVWHLLDEKCHVTRKQLKSCMDEFKMSFPEHWLFKRFQRDSRTLIGNYGMIRYPTVRIYLTTPSPESKETLIDATMVMAQPCME